MPKLIKLTHFIASVTACVSLCGIPILASAQTIPETENGDQRQWQVCNETSFILNIATASVAEGMANAPLTVRGWQKLRAGKCQTMSVEKGTPRYVYARSSSVHQGGIREWTGKYNFCVADPHADTGFTAKTDIACDVQNLTSAKFLRVIPTEKRTAFVEPSDYGKKAQTAGLQRLLMDNNHDIKRVDGIGGRRTSNTLRAFLRAQKLPTGLSLNEQLDALETTAQAAQTSVGLTICNSAPTTLWSAIAYRAESGSANVHWESRGWWPVAPKACVRPFAQNLKGIETYVYARLEIEGQSDLVLKMPATPNDITEKSVNKEFCISEAGFAATMHEFCEDQGYVKARFKPVTNTETGVTLTLSESDFVQASASGLR